MDIDEKRFMSMTVGIFGIVMLGQIVQGLIPSKDYCCTVCGECFYTLDDLYDHFISAHPGVDPLPILPSVAVVNGYVRQENPSTSEMYSGWIGISTLGSEISLLAVGSRIQAGAVVQNLSPYAVTMDYTARNHHWIEPNNYTDQALELPLVEPVAYSPCMTGLPFSGGVFEVEKFAPPGVVLEPNESGFVYTSLVTRSRRWNYYYLGLLANGYDIGETLLFVGWGGS